MLVSQRDESRELVMSNFKKLADAMQFSPDKMKKNGIFETEHFFCDTYCFEPGQSQSPHTQIGRASCRERV